MSLQTSTTTEPSTSAASPRKAAFSEGDVVVYPAQGVADIVGLESKTIGGTSLEFYHLQVRDSGLKIIVPTAKAEDNGMRRIAGEREIEEMLTILRDHSVPSDRQTWNRRYRGFMEKIRTGSLFEVAEVYRDLALLRTTKQLSHGEKQMLRTALDLLVKELAAARNSPGEEVAAELESMFSH